MTEVHEAVASDPPVAPPVDAPIELDRLRRNVRAELFGGEAEPTRIGRFRLLACVGRGGMGVVWSAHDDELDRKVAIKLLRPELSARDLTNEARALAKLSHPNVVSVFDVGEHGGQRFIAMEFVEGDTLRMWLAQPRGLSDIVDVFVAAGEGLAAAHDVGLVHRDFKPDNVLVGADGRPRVLDFGLARPPDPGAASEPPALDADADPLATSMTQAGLMLGTPAYMAPEQHLGDSADARSDQFAFAVALYEGLTGALPFKGADLRTLSLAVVRGKLVTPPSGAVPPALFEVVKRALSVDPDARYPDIRTLIAALQGSVQDSGGRLDTRQVDAVLARAAELQAAAPSRPGLTPAEVEAVAVEAGIDAVHVNRATSEALAPVVTPSAAVVLPNETAPAQTESLPAFVYDVSITRRCGRVSHAVGQLLLREMERREGSGKSEQLGASTVWQNRTTELHIDPVGDETRLVLRRKLGALARSRPWRYGAMGAMLFIGTLVPLAESLFPHAEAAIVLVVFFAIGMGIFNGRKLAHYLHERERGRHRDELGATAERLAELTEANTFVA